jgi:hypothetical protein
MSAVGAARRPHSTSSRVRPGQAELSGVQDQSDRVLHARGPTAELLAVTLREVSLEHRRTMKDTSGW